MGIRQNVIQNWASGQQKSLVFVYYAGHGIMDNHVHMVCNGGARASKYIYPLQHRLNCLAQETGCYVLGIFDCCREKLVPAMRGGAPAEPLEDDVANDN